MGDRSRRSDPSALSQQNQHRGSPEKAGRSEPRLREKVAAEKGSMPPTSPPPSPTTLLAAFSEPTPLFILGLILRLILLVVGFYKDAGPPPKFTDIDHEVFLDAAHFVSIHQSPYLRSTYRYTPLLAWLLSPAYQLPYGRLWFGKALFILSDLAVVVLAVRVLQAKLPSQTAARWVAALWGLNPFIAVISTRGNCETFLALMMVAVVWAVEAGKWGRGAVVFGLAVHFKIYPVMHAVAVWRALRPGRWEGKGWPKWVRDAVNFLSWERAGFGVLSASVFFGFGAIMYA
ncbi:GPI mannosyltransferase 1, partial [Phlyctochytrium bullatum]